MEVKDYNWQHEQRTSFNDALNLSEVLDCMVLHKQQLMTFNKF